ncbi:APC family permease [Bacteriovorax sp. DB6_IX]|uniref:APC family permease n=1 Tax=Bacteriovorax sp. DB6_IX TaxID=1353530 RepID=UPI000389EF54|nr:amino acid permease [Bacteriovorax sp. DB6_IX]EQC51541.1 amino acid permease [Bacteriovorax sp. DB6_IX]
MKKLERSLGLTAVVAISIGSMLGSGIFVLPGLAFELTGPSVWLGYLVAAICVLPAAMSKSELATAMPTSGGTYVYLERTFGPLAGTISGLGLWLSLLLKASFALVGFGAYLSVLTDYDLNTLALSLTLVITILNIVGVGKVSSFLIFIVACSLGCLLLLDTTIMLNPIRVEIDNWFPNGGTGFLKSAGLVFVSYAGVTKVAAIAEEIKDPEKNLPRGIMISLFTVAAVYCFTTYALAKFVPMEALKGNLKPIYTMATTYGGHTFGSFIAVLAILTMTSMANAGVLASSRFPFAMGRDNLIPSRFGHLHKKFLTPVWSILISGLLIAAVILFLDVPKIAKLASSFILIIYLLENVAVIVLRETRVQWYRPSYRSRFYPFTQIIGIIASLVLLSEMGQLAIVGLLSISIPGIFIFLAYGRKRTNRKGVVGIRGKRADLVDEKVFGPSSIETMDLSRDASVVVALLGKERSPEMLIEMGASLTGEGSLEVAHLTEAPEQTDLSDFIDEPAELRSLRRRVIAMAIEKGVPITFDPVVSHDIAKTIYEVSQRMHCQWLMLEWAGRGRGNFTVSTPIDWLKSHLECNLAIFRDTGVRYVRKILVILNHHPIDNTVVETAAHFAEVNKADITFGMFVPEGMSEEMTTNQESYINNTVAHVKTRKSTMLLTGQDKVEVISGSAVEFDLLVIGATTKYSWKNKFGTEEDKIIADAACSVICLYGARTITK